jgi:hypothetical protein
MATTTGHTSAIRSIGLSDHLSRSAKHAAPAATTLQKAQKGPQTVKNALAPHGM